MYRTKLPPAVAGAVGNAAASSMNGGAAVPPAKEVEKNAPSSPSPAASTAPTAVASQTQQTPLQQPYVPQTPSSFSSTFKLARPPRDFTDASSRRRHSRPAASHSPTSADTGSTENTATLLTTQTFVPRRSTSLGAISQKNLELKMVDPILPRGLGWGSQLNNQKQEEEKGVTTPHASPSPLLLPPIIPLTASLFEDLLQCPKRFLLNSFCAPSDMPQLSAGDLILMEDGQQFAQLCRQKYTLGVDESTLFRISSHSFENALEETATMLDWYFGKYLPSHDPLTLPPITLLMPAFNAFVDASKLSMDGHQQPQKQHGKGDQKPSGDARGGGGGLSFELRTRINILQYFPSSNVWLSHLSKASTDLGQKDKEHLYLKQLFNLYTLRHCADVEGFGGGGGGDATSRFSSSFYRLNETAPQFVKTLTDRSISVGGCASKPSMAGIGEDAYAGSSYRRGGGGDDGDGDYGSRCGSGKSMSTIDVLQSRMVPITEDCFDRRTLAAMLSSIPASTLRGAFMGGQYTVESMMEAELMRLTRDGGDADGGGDGNKDSNGGRGRGRGGRGRGGRGGAASSSILPPAAIDILNKMQSQRSPSDSLVPLTASSLVDALADPAALEYPLVLPEGAARMPDMSIGDVLMAYAAKVLGSIGTAEPDSNKNPSSSIDSAATTLKRGLATWEAKPSLQAAIGSIDRQLQQQQRGGGKGKEEAVSPTLASDCFREACSDCAFFTEGFCKASSKGKSQKAASDGGVDAEDPTLVFNLPGVRATAKKKLYRNNLKSASQLLPLASTVASTATELSIASPKSPALSGSAPLLSLDDDLPRLSDKQQLYIYCAANNLVAVNPKHIRRWLAAIKFPLIALDFEATAFALPRFSKLRPYGPVPFQFTALAYAADPLGSQWANAFPFSLSAHLKEKGGVANAIAEKSGPNASSSLMDYLKPFLKSKALSALSVAPRQTAFCHLGSGFDAREDPRRRTGNALVAMLDNARRWQREFNATCSDASSNLATTTHSLTPPQAILDTLKVGKSNKKQNSSTIQVQPPTPSVAAPHPALIRGSTNKYRADALLDDGIHTTISKAANNALIIDDPHAHGVVIGHNVSFERSCFQTISSLVRDEGNPQHGYVNTGHIPQREQRGKPSAPKAVVKHNTSDIFDSLVFMDTLKLVSDGILHPLAKGSNSLKRLVPALVPHVGSQYEDLTIADGQTASATYRDWLAAVTRRMPTDPNSEEGSSSGTTATLPLSRYEKYAQHLAALNNTYDAKRADLIKYCNTDTEQMVAVVKEVSRLGELAEVLKGLAEEAGGGAAKPKKGKGGAAAAAASATTSASSALPLPPPELAPLLRCVDLGKGWIGIPLETVVRTRDEAGK